MSERKILETDLVLNFSSFGNSSNLLENIVNESREIKKVNPLFFLSIPRHFDYVCKIEVNCDEVKEGKAYLMCINDKDGTTIGELKSFKGFWGIDEKLAVLSSWKTAFFLIVGGSGVSTTVNPLLSLPFVKFVGILQENCSLNDALYKWEKQYDFGKMTIDKGFARIGERLKGAFEVGTTDKRTIEKTVNETKIPLKIEATLAGRKSSTGDISPSRSPKSSGPMIGRMKSDSGSARPKSSSISRTNSNPGTPRQDDRRKSGVVIKMRK